MIPVIQDGQLIVKVIRVPATDAFLAGDRMVTCGYYAAREEAERYIEHRKARNGEQRFVIEVYRAEIIERLER